MDPTRRKILKTGAAATVVAAAPGVFAQQAATSGTGKFYAKGPVRIHYQESGSGFPLMLISGGGLNSTIAGLRSPFDAVGEFKSEYRCIAADLRTRGRDLRGGVLRMPFPAAVSTVRERAGSVARAIPARRLPSRGCSRPMTRLRASRRRVHRGRW